MRQGKQYVKRFIVRALEHGCYYKDNIFGRVWTIAGQQFFYPFDRPHWVHDHKMVEWSEKLDRRWKTHVWGDELGNQDSGLS